MGVEIDMLIDRDDGAITLCELKYSSQPFTIDKAYAKILENKVITFEKHIKPSKHIFLVIVASNGFKKNFWSEDLVSNSLSLKNLF